MAGRLSMCEYCDALSGHGFIRAAGNAKSKQLYRLRKKSKRFHPERSEGSQRLTFATTYANSTLRYMSADRRIGLFSATSSAAEVLFSGFEIQTSSLHTGSSVSPGVRSSLVSVGRLCLRGTNAIR